MELSQDQILALKKLVVSKEWELARTLWTKHLQQREREKADSLRLAELNEAIRLQGYIDGCNDLIHMIEGVIKPKHQEPDQPYR